jgi:very-short-patch-repair endonuclease
VKEETVFDGLFMLTRIRKSSGCVKYAAVNGVQLQTIETRMKTGCPSCKEGHNVSFDESAFVYFYKQVFLDVKFNYEVETEDKRYKVDLFVPKYNLILEDDSEFFHRHRFQSNLEKSIQLLKNNYRLFRMREKGFPEIITHGINIVPFQNKNKEKLQSAIIDSFGYIKDKVQLTQDELNRMEETYKQWILKSNYSIFLNKSLH